MSIFILLAPLAEDNFAQNQKSGGYLQLLLVLQSLSALEDIELPIVGTTSLFGCEAFRRWIYCPCIHLVFMPFAWARELPKWHSHVGLHVCLQSPLHGYYGLCPPPPPPSFVIASSFTKSILLGDSHGSHLVPKTPPSFTSLLSIPYTFAQLFVYLISISQICVRQCMKAVVLFLWHLLILSKIVQGGWLVWWKFNVLYGG